jgi:elongation factor G
MGDIIGDFKASWSDHGMESQASLRVVLANVPLAEMFGYVTYASYTLSSGRATSTMEFSHYDIVPPALSAELIEKITGTKVLV